MILYIDPGTGSMLFTVLLGIITTLYFFLQKLVLKLKIWLSGGRNGKVDTTQIPYVIFVDDKRYWEMFKSVCDIFEERKTNISYWTCSKDDPALEAEYEYVKAEYIGNINAASVRLNRMKAGICIATTPGLDVYQWKRSKNTQWYVHLMHGAGDARAYKMFGLDFFDAVLVAGSHQEKEIRQMEKIWKRPEKEIEIVGEPHIDNLLERYNNEKSEDDGKTTVLLAPSWGSSGILSKYGDKFMDVLVATGYNIIIRPHPQSLSSEKEMIEHLRNKYPENDKLTWNLDNDNFDALNKADIMISDFSSVIWDYMLVFDKPVIYADVDFDDSQYDLHWTGEERWDMLALEKTGMKSTEDKFDDLKEMIDKSLSSAEMAAEREMIKNEAWDKRGESAERIADYMMGKYEQLSPAT